MNKIKTTKREMRDNYYIIGVGYCQATNLLNYESAIAYSVGVYGWACDYYEINGVVLSYGYQPLSDKNTKLDYEVLKSYDNKAKLIISNVGSYDQKRNAVKLLLSEFIEQAKQSTKGVK
jgi:hypothetical protein